MVNAELKPFSLVILSKHNEDFRDLGFDHVSLVGEISALETVMKSHNVDLLVLDMASFGLESSESLHEITSHPGIESRLILLILDGTQFQVLDHEDIVAKADQVLLHPFSKEELKVVIGCMAKSLRDRDLVERRSEVTRNLFQIVAHDISNLFTNFEVLLQSFERRKDPALIEKKQMRARITMCEVRELLRNAKSLDSMKSESLILNLSPVSVQDSVETICDVFADRLERKDLKIEFEWKTSRDVQILADAVSFKHQVLGNILTNAIKFSYPKSTIKISVSDREDLIAISIKDSGVGMPSDVIKNVFDEKKSKSREGTSGEMGTGYGMPLAYNFVQAYKGSIEVESVCENTCGERRGTTFIVLVPRVEEKVA